MPTPHAVLFVRGEPASAPSGDTATGQENLAAQPSAQQGDALEACVVLAEDVAQAMVGAGTALTQAGRGDAILIGAMSLAQVEGLADNMRKAVTGG